MTRAAATIAVIALAFVSACSSDDRDLGRGSYIALGNSLSVGIGATAPDSTGFVPLVLDGLGAGYELINLGHGGDTSADLLNHGHLDTAVAEIESRNGDDDETNDVRLVTLEIGGNDLLRIYTSLVQSGTCPDLDAALSTEECRDALASTLQGFAPNLERALDLLQEADPSLQIVLLTLYNPFSGYLPSQEGIADLSLEGLPDTSFPEGMNDIIRKQAANHGIAVADVYLLFEGRAAGMVASDFIHPNDAGHRAMAGAVIELLATP